MLGLTWQPMDFLKVRGPRTYVPSALDLHQAQRGKKLGDPVVEQMAFLSGEIVIPPFCAGNAIFEGL